MKSGGSSATLRRSSIATAKQGIGPDLHTASIEPRLLGRDPKLVLHGGGNTSSRPGSGSPRRDGRGAVRQRLGRRHGHPRAGEPAGSAARRLRKLRAREALNDPDW